MLVLRSHAGSHVESPRFCTIPRHRRFDARASYCHIAIADFTKSAIDRTAPGVARRLPPRCRRKRNCRAARMMRTAAVREHQRTGGDLPPIGAAPRLRVRSAALSSSAAVFGGLRRLSRWRLRAERTAPGAASSKPIRKSSGCIASMSKAAKVGAGKSFRLKVSPNRVPGLRRSTDQEPWPSPRRPSV